MTSVTKIKSSSVINKAVLKRTMKTRSNDDEEDEEEDDDEEQDLGNYNILEIS